MTATGMALPALAQVHPMRISGLGGQLDVAGNQEASGVRLSVRHGGGQNAHFSRFFGPEGNHSGMRSRPSQASGGPTKSLQLLQKHGYTLFGVLDRIHARPTQTARVDRLRLGGRVRLANGGQRSVFSVALFEFDPGALQIRTRSLEFSLQRDDLSDVLKLSDESNFSGE
eukprot:951457_1